MNILKYCHGKYIFAADYKNCEDICGKPLSIAHNATAFIWCPRIGARVSVT